MTPQTVGKWALILAMFGAGMMFGFLYADDLLGLQADGIGHIQFIGMGTGFTVLIVGLMFFHERHRLV
jgi:hypothetical protein